MSGRQFFNNYCNQLYRVRLVRINKNETMRLILNIFFEKLHRYVYDHYYKSTNTDFGLPTKYVIANRHNKLEPYNKQIADFYNWLCPYFVGWRESLVKKYPDKPKYQRYK